MAEKRVTNEVDVAAVRTLAHRPQPGSNWDIVGNTLGSAKQFCEMVLSSGLLPNAVNSPQKALVILLKGKELGLDPMVALAELYVVNGKPGISSAMMMALALRRGIRFKWLTEPDREAQEAILEITRPDGASHIERFTIEEASRAGLAQRDTWRSWTANMLRSRALSRGIRYFAPDILLAYTTDELEDMDQGIPTQDISGLDTRRAAFLDDLDARRIEREKEDAEHQAAKRRAKRQPTGKPDPKPVEEAEEVDEDLAPPEDDDLDFLEPDPETAAPEPSPAPKSPPGPTSKTTEAILELAGRLGILAEGGQEVHVDGQVASFTGLRPGLYRPAALEKKVANKMVVILKALAEKRGV